MSAERDRRYLAHILESIELIEPWTGSGRDTFLTDDLVQNATLYRLETLAEAAGFERFHLYGHSGGGACALAYVATYPERVLPQIRVLVATMFQDDASLFMDMRAGARGYVLKVAEKDDILRAIRAVGDKHGPSALHFLTAGIS